MTIRQHKGWRLILFCILLGGALGGHILYQHLPRQTAPEHPEPSGRISGVPVVLTPASLRHFERILALTGNLEAREFALVTPRRGGPLDDIFVDEGDFVEAHKTPLFQTDAVTLGKSLEVARQQHAVAKWAVKEKRASLERIQADFTNIEQDYARGKKLFAQKAISTSAFEDYESAYHQSLAVIKHAKVLIELSREQEIQARLNLDIAEKNLQDSLVKAPISGVVTKRFKEPGEMGEVGKPVVSIENLNMLEISAFVPEEFYDQIIPGSTPVRIRVGSLVLPSQTITYKSPTIARDLRTFEIQTLISPVPPGVAPGRIAHLEILLDEHTALGVPRQAVVEKRKSKVLYREENLRAREIPVKTGLETGGWVEILASSGDAVLEEGTPVLSQGQLFVEEGTPISPVKGETP